MRILTANCTVISLLETDHDICMWKKSPPRSGPGGDLPSRSWGCSSSPWAVCVCVCVIDKRHNQTQWIMLIIY